MGKEWRPGHLVRKQAQLCPVVLKLHMEAKAFLQTLMWFQERLRNTQGLKVTIWRQKQDIHSPAPCRAILQGAGLKFSCG